MSQLNPLPPTRSDPELIQAFLNGDRSARDRVLSAWAPTVLTWCMRLGGPRIDAHDAAQDAMIVVLTKGHNCREAERFPAWVYGVVRKVLASHRRKAWVRYWVGMPLPDRADPSQGPLVRAQLTQTGRRVQLVLEALTEDQREILVLHDLEGRSATECGRLLDLPVGTVKSRVRRARARFKSEADQLGLHTSIEDALQGGLGH